jgi:hypothetical protein
MMNRSKNAILASVSVSEEQAIFLRRRGVEYGFRYEEVLEQYRLAKGDLRETVQRLRNLQDAALLILEDQAEAESAAEAEAEPGIEGEDMNEDRDLKEDKLDLADNTHDAHTGGGSTSSHVSGGVVQAEVDEEKEVLNSNLPPPNSAAKALQLRMRRRSLRHV